MRCTILPEQELHILLIDDDEDDAIIIRELLEDIERIKLVFDWVPTYEQGVDLICKNDWSAVLVDYDLGLKNGLELIREAAAMHIKTPMIMVTGRGRYEIDIEAMRAGAADYLSKDELNSPFLERTIRFAIEHRRIEEELEQRVQERTQEIQFALALFEGLFEASPDAILLVMEDGTVQRANRQAETIFGYSGEELEGKPVEQLIPSRFHNLHVRHRSGYISSPHTRKMGEGLSLFGLHKDSHEFPVDITLSPLSVLQQNFVICVIRDMTERHE